MPTSQKQQIAAVRRIIGLDEIWSFFYFTERCFSWHERNYSRIKWKQIQIWRFYGLPNAPQKWLPDQSRITPKKEVFPPSGGTFPPFSGESPYPSIVILSPYNYYSTWKLLSISHLLLSLLLMSNVFKCVFYQQKKILREKNASFYNIVYTIEWWNYFKILDMYFLYVYTDHVHILVMISQMSSSTI